MNELLERFKALVETRLLHQRSFQAFGEDSIRYDFYIALMQQYNLLPHQIILEQPIPASQFLQRERNQENRGRGRHEDKPEFDIRVDAANALQQGILAEFAFFRRPEVASNQHKSGQHGKILNEIFRLSLLKHFQNPNNNPRYQNFNNYDCLLICVTDDEMINYGAVGVQGPQAIPVQQEYSLNDNFLSELSDTTRSKVESKFKEKAFSLGIIPTATRIANIVVPVNQGLPRWAIWVWSVNYVHN